MDKIMLKVMCKKLGIERLDLADQRLVLSFSENCDVSPDRITDLIQRSPRRFRLTPDGVLEVSMKPGEYAYTLKATKKVLQDLG
jgi:transcription-repair coupling factor (superfamily II helicase)